mmetsp:Transcript_12529/g.31750  ORF Transcript_12529/g.31750 Transcript_12529/m.31750 type:complete len:205 (+) Transcript_12529:215-829(+)
MFIKTAEGALNQDIVKAVFACQSRSVRPAATARTAPPAFPLCCLSRRRGSRSTRLLPTTGLQLRAWVRACLPRQVTCRQTPPCVERRDSWGAGRPSALCRSRRTPSGAAATCGWVAARCRPHARWRWPRSSNRAPWPPPHGQKNSPAAPYAALGCRRGVWTRATNCWRRPRHRVALLRVRRATYRRRRPRRASAARRCARRGRS